MKPLDYLYLALVKVVPASEDGTVSETIGERSKPLTWLKSSHLSTTVNLLAVAIALSILGMARQASAVVQHGDRGAEVSALQERLKELGYFRANATGYFGGITKAAVREFQQERGLTPDGIVGTETQAALDEQQQEEQTEQSSADGVWQLGDRGEEVAAIQKRLAYAGYFAGKRAVFDEETQEAVRQFQQAKGLVVDGIVGQQTQAALPKIGESQPVPESKQFLRKDEDKPAREDSEATPESTQTPLWYEDEAAPLQPFIR